MTDSELRQLKPVELLELLIKTAQRGIELINAGELKPFSDFVRPAREPLTVIGDFEIWARFEDSPKGFTKAPSLAELLHLSPDEAERRQELIALSASMQKASAQIVFGPSNICSMKDFLDGKYTLVSLSGKKGCWLISVHSEELPTKKIVDDPGGTGG